MILSSTTPALCTGRHAFFVRIEWDADIYQGMFVHPNKRDSLRNDVEIQILLDTTPALCAGREAAIVIGRAYLIEERNVNTCQGTVLRIQVRRDMLVGAIHALMKAVDVRDGLRQGWLPDRRKLQEVTRQPRPQATKCLSTLFCRLRAVIDLVQ